MASSTNYDIFDREERLRRIGMLFSKAATLILDSQSLANRIQQTKETEAIAVLTKQHDGRADWQRQLFERFISVGEFTPKDALRLWATSRTSCYRRLQRLMKEGMIIPQGRTKALRYRFTPMGIALFQPKQKPMNG